MILSAVFVFDTVKWQLCCYSVLPLRDNVMKLFCAGLAIAFSLVSTVAFSAIITGYSYGKDKTYMVASYLPLRRPVPNEDYSKVVNYYRQLNISIVKKNPVLDAQQALALGRIEQLTTFGQMIDKTYLSNNLGDPFNKLDVSAIPQKLIQGSGFEDLWFTFKGDIQARKVLTIYAQSTIRYAYYWNRTVAHHIRQKTYTAKNKNDTAIKLVKNPPLPLLKPWVRIAYPMVRLEGILTLKEGCLFIRDTLLVFPHDTYVLDSNYPQKIRLKSKPAERTIQVSKWASFGGSGSSKGINKGGCSAKSYFGINPIHRKDKSNGVQPKFHMHKANTCLKKVSHVHRFTNVTHSHYPYAPCKK